MHLTKADTDLLKGWAIVAMLAHHLFAFPERLFGTAVVAPTGAWLIYIATLGKLCVPMFLILSGYGFARSGHNDWGYYWDKVRRFMECYWFYFLVFVPLGLFYFGKHTAWPYTPFAHFNAQTWLENLLLLSNSMSLEWWFAQPYVLFVLLTPVLIKWARNPLVVLVCAGLIWFISQGILKPLPIPYFKSLEFFRWIFPFVLGLYLGQRPTLVPSFNAPWQKSLWIATLVGGGVALMCLKADSMLLLSAATGMLVVGAVAWLPCWKQWARAGWEFLGRYSFPMWLTHTFFCYYYMQEFIYAPRNPLLILGLLIGVNVAVVVVLEALRKRLVKA